MTASKTDVLIVGGGISGLSAALLLKEAGLTVRVLEAAPEAGGNLRSLHEGPYICEIGPHAFMPSADEMWELVAHAGADAQVAAAAASSATRFIFREGRLHALPMNAWSFLTTRVLTMKGKLRLCAEPFVKGAAAEGESAAEFFTRRLGPEAVQWLVGPFISGIYGGDPARLGAHDAFPKMWNWEREGGSMVLGARRYLKAKAKERAHLPKRKGLFSFTGGLGVLVDGVTAKLGAALHTGEAALAVTRLDEGFRVATANAAYEARELIVAVPPHEASALLGNLSEPLARELSEVVLAPMALVHMAFGKEDSAAIPDGFGFLVPRGQGLRTLGCLFASRMFPERAPEGETLVASYIGGVFDPQAIALTEEELVRLAAGELSKALHHDFTPIFSRALTVKRAIPQLVPGHRARVARIRALAEETGGLILAGNYLSGVGVNDAVASGLAAARALLARRQEGAA